MEDMQEKRIKVDVVQAVRSETPILGGRKNRCIHRSWREPSGKQPLQKIKKEIYETFWREIHLGEKRCDDFESRGAGRLLTVSLGDSVSK